MGLLHNVWLCHECTSPSFAVCVCVCVWCVCVCVCVKSSLVFGYLVTTWNYWVRGKDFGMCLQIRYFTLK
jgi:hypothetical protein